MSEDPARHNVPERQQLYYLVPGQDGEAADRRAIELTQLVGVLWRRKLTLLACGLALAVIAYLSSFAIEPRFQASLLMAPADEKTGTSMLGQLGGLASLAGISVGGAKTEEPLAILKSREFARRFIVNQNLVPLLYRDRWDASRNAWGSAADEPDMREAVRKFHSSVLSASEDRRTGLITVRIAWFDAEQAAQLANSMVRQLNEDLQQRAIAEAERNIEYLKSESGSSQIVPLQQSIGRLLEAELQKHMLAKGNDEFAFKVLDPAFPPQRPASPRRLLLAALGMLVGMAAASVWALVRYWPAGSSSE